MDILDIHTHRMPVELGQAIQNCQPAEFDPLAGAYYSVGIHPWYLTRENLDRQWEMLLAAIQCPQVLAIGEAGLDKLVRTDYMLQQEVFEKQAMLAHEMKYPLVIHAVRSANEIICLRKKMKPSNPWIIHGFRGKKELALQYIQEGIYVSLGEKYQEEVLWGIPLEYLFLETDESMIDIHCLYERAALLLEIPLCKLMQQVRQNINNVFFRQ